MKIPSQAAHSCLVHLGLNHSVWGCIMLYTQNLSNFLVAYLGCDGRIPFSFWCNCLNHPSPYSFAHTQGPRDPCRMRCGTPCSIPGQKPLLSNGDGVPRPEAAATSVNLMAVWWSEIKQETPSNGHPGSMLSCFSDFLLFCFSAFLLLCFSASLLLCFFAAPASLLLCFSAFCFPCFSAFPAFLLFAFASLLFCFSVFPASLLLYFCAFLLLLFYFFFSSVMCFCCSTSCSFASLLPVFTVSLFFIFFCFILFCLYPKWNPRETLGETQRNPKEILIRNPTWSPKWTLKKP